MWGRIPAQIPSRKKKLVLRSVSPAWIFQLARQPANSSSTAPPELSESPGAATGGHATHSMVNSRDLTAQQILQAGPLSPPTLPCPTMVAKLVSHRCPSCEDHCGFSVLFGTCVVICANVLIRGARNVGGAQKATAQGIHGDQ